MASKKVTYQSKSFVFVLIILGFFAIGNYLLYKKFVRLDLTENKMYSISPASKRMLKGLDDIINITVYFSKNLPPHTKKLEADVKDMLSEFQAFGGKNLHISWQDPIENEQTKQKVQSLGIPEVQLQTYEKDKAQVINAFMGIAVLFADKKEVLPVVQNTNNFEYELAQCIMKVSRKETPKIAVIKTDTSAYIDPMIRYQMRGKMPPDPTEEKYKPIFENLKGNYDVTTLDLSDGKPIDQQYRAIIIPGGDDNSFTDRKLFEIDQYFMNGGNLIVFANAVRIEMEYGVNARVQHPKILDLLESYGVKVEKNLVLDVSCGQVQIPQQVGPFQMNVPVNYPYIIRIIPSGFNNAIPAVSGLAQLIIPWANPLTLTVDTIAAKAKGDTSSTVKATILVRSSDKSIIQTGEFDLNPQQDWNKVFNAKKDALKSTILSASLHGNFKSYFAGKAIPPAKKSTFDTSALQLSAEDKNRTITPSNSKRTLIVVGNADFMTPQSSAPGNVAFLQNVVDWVSQDENLIGIRSRQLEDRSIKNNQIEDGKNTDFIRWINILSMPLILIIIGIMIFMRRRETAESTPVTTVSSQPKQGN